VAAANPKTVVRRQDGRPGVDAVGKESSRDRRGLVSGEMDAEVVPAVRWRLQPLRQTPITFPKKVGPIFPPHAGAISGVKDVAQYSEA